MNPEGEWVENVEANLAVAADLRLRFQGKEAQLLAARAEARRLALELPLTRRLLKFALDGLPPGRRVAATQAAPRRAALLTAPARFHLDACEHQGQHTVISGWAFRPVLAWDSHAATVTLLFRHGETAYAATTGPVPRPDVAAHFAAQAPEESGGAVGLEGAGFRCEIVNESLPEGVEWELVLRLECAGVACEQATGQRLRF